MKSRTCPSGQNVLFAPLESRLHLAAHTAGHAAAASALPVDLETLGDSVYFQQSGVTAMNVKTGERTQIVRDDGTPFGKLPITLDATPGRLLITEQVQVKSEWPPYQPDLYQVWSVAAGSRVATKLIDGPREGQPSVVATAGGVAYVRIAGHLYYGSSDFYGVDAQHAKAFDVADVSFFGKKATISQLAPWGSGRLALQVGAIGTAYQFFSYDIKHKTFKTLSNALPGGDFAYSKLSVAGGSLVINASTSGSQGAYIQRVYTLAGESASWKQYTPIAKNERTQLLSIVNGRALVLAKDDTTGYDLETLVYTDFSTPGTLSLLTNYDPQDRSELSGGDGAYLVKDNALYASAGNPLSAYGQGNALIKFDLKTGAHLTLASGADLGEFSANSFVNAGKVIYFRRSFVSPAKNRPIAELWQTDGTPAGTIRVTAANAGPILAGGFVLYTAKATATSLSTPPAPHVGGIDGRIVRDDDRKADLSSPSLGGMSRFEIYIDRNNNHRLDTGEQHVTSDDDGYYRLQNLTPGKQRVRFKFLQGFTPTRGSALRLDVRAGRGTHYDFGMAEDAPGPVSGTLVDYNGQLQSNLTVWVDLNRNGKRDSGEPTSNSGYDGTFDFGTSLRASAGATTYRVLVYKRKDIYFDLFVPAGGSTTLRLEAWTN